MRQDFVSAAHLLSDAVLSSLRSRTQMITAATPNHALQRTAPGVAELRGVRQLALVI
jgi:hypothetical protein